MVGDCEKGHGIKTKYLVAASAIVDEMGTVFEVRKKMEFLFPCKVCCTKNKSNEDYCNAFD